MTWYLTNSQLDGLSIGDQFVADYMERIRLDELSLENKMARQTLTNQDVLDIISWRLDAITWMMPEELYEVDMGWPADLFGTLTSMDSFELRLDHWKFGPFFFYDLADCLLGDDEAAECRSEQTQQRHT